jgi:hypothetical protein
MRRLAMIVATIVALGVGTGCITPSIPIPPPDPERMTFAITLDGGNSLARFSYPPDSNYIGSIVFIYDRDRGEGIIADAHPDGSVGPTGPLAAAIGDQVIVSFQREDQTVSTCVRLRDGTQSSLDSCGP